MNDSCSVRGGWLWNKSSRLQQYHWYRLRLVTFWTLERDDIDHRKSESQSYKVIELKDDYDFHKSPVNQHDRSHQQGLTPKNMGMYTNEVSFISSAGDGFCYGVPVYRANLWGDASGLSPTFECNSTEWMSGPCKKFFSLFQLWEQRIYLDHK